jgi:hypothetical protein
LQELAQPVVENPDDGKPPESATWPKTNKW